MMVAPQPKYSGGTRHGLRFQALVPVIYRTRRDLEAGVTVVVIEGGGGGSATRAHETNVLPMWEKNIGDLRASEIDSGRVRFAQYRSLRHRLITGTS